MFCCLVLLLLQNAGTSVNSQLHHHQLSGEIHTQTDQHSIQLIPAVNYLPLHVTFFLQWTFELHIMCIWQSLSHEKTCPPNKLAVLVILSIFFFFFFLQHLIYITTNKTIKGCVVFFLYIMALHHWAIAVDWQWKILDDFLFRRSPFC